LDAYLDGREQLAREHLDTAASALRQVDVDGALREYQKATAVARDVADASPLQRALADAVAERLAELVRQRLAAEELEAALGEYLSRRRDSGALQASPTVEAVGRELASALLAFLRRDSGSPLTLRLARRLVAAEALPGRGDQLKNGAVAFAQAMDLRPQGPSEALARALLAAGEEWSADALTAEARTVQGKVAKASDRLQEARTVAAEGRFVDARVVLTALVEEFPMHGEARAELDLLDQGAKDRERLLAEARELARTGRLRTACGQAMALAGPGTGGDEARLLVKDVRARMDLVARGIDEVRAALHGRDAAAVQGCRQSLLRLQELQKVQSDHEDLPRLIEAVQVEIEGLEACERAARELTSGKLAAGAEQCLGLLGFRPQLLSPERLDARVLELVDRLARHGEDAMAAGRLGEVELCCRVLQAAGEAGLGTGLCERSAGLRSAVAARHARIEELAAIAEASLASRDLEAAEKAVEEARQLSAAATAVRRLEDELRGLRAQEAALAGVEAMTAERDFAGAHRRLHGLPPTPPQLRTRIFDMKQSLAKAQGLEGAFLLRVDEGGEYLVFRAETVSIGNVREARSDLPILANLAGRHAQIRRSMSFHGGMQDTLEALDGEVRLRGAKVGSQPLKSGDRFALGPSLQVQYQVPSPRSLTSALQLLGGFQVAGTDRILLLKDRGRDGRILIGQARDAHVRVANAVGEVEVFAHKNGQIRVRVEGQGTLDGKPFSGEHPVDAGMIVQAAGVSFLLLPWQRS
jgi:hypothetical protein